MALLSHRPAAIAKIKTSVSGEQMPMFVAPQAVALAARRQLRVTLTLHGRCS